MHYYTLSFFLLLSCCLYLSASEKKQLVSMPPELCVLSKKTDYIPDTQQFVGCINAQPGKKNHAYILQQDVCITLLKKLEQHRSPNQLPYTTQEIRGCFNKKHLRLMITALEQALEAA